MRIGDSTPKVGVSPLDADFSAQSDEQRSITDATRKSSGDRQGTLSPHQLLFSGPPQTRSDAGAGRSQFAIPAGTAPLGSGQSSRQGRTQIEVGRKALLFVKSDGIFAPSLVISAHGFYTSKTPTFSPKSSLHFYVDHGDALAEVPSALSIDVKRPTETVSAGVQGGVHDYQLFKYQEHSGLIEEKTKEWNKQNPDNQMTLQEMAKEIGLIGGGETYETFLNAKNDKNDFLTIRNRNTLAGGPLVSLSQILKDLEGIHHYDLIKCVFCREPKPDNFKPS